jgi:hypothetical protein
VGEPLPKIKEPDEYQLGADVVGLTSPKHGDDCCGPYHRPLAIVHDGLGIKVVQAPLRPLLSSRRFALEVRTG